MPGNMVNGFNVNGTPVLYNYDSLGNKLEKISIAREYSNTDTYNVDDYVIYNGKMYRCKREISVGESFDSTKWTECSIGPELNYIKKFVGFSEEAKYALLNLLAHVAYTDEHGQDYYDELEATLFQPAKVVSIYAVFNQGSVVIYSTDDLDMLRQYLTVTAIYEDMSEREVTTYTLSGTLTVGTSTITVSYGGKTATFDVVVSSYWDYEWDYTMGKLEDQDEWANTISGTSATTLESNGEKITAATGGGQSYIVPNLSSGVYIMENHKGIFEAVFVLNLPSNVGTGFKMAVGKGPGDGVSSGISITTRNMYLTYNTGASSNTNIVQIQNSVEYTLRLEIDGSTGYIYLNGEKVATVNNTDATLYAGKNYVAVQNVGATNYYVLLKSVKIKSGGI